MKQRKFQLYKHSANHANLIFTSVRYGERDGSGLMPDMRQAENKLSNVLTVIRTTTELCKEAKLMAIWGLTYKEQREQKNEQPKVQPKVQLKKTYKEKNQAEIEKGYQPWFATFAVQLDDGRFAIHETVYRHRRLNIRTEQYYWEYHEATISFRFHVVQDKNIPVNELRAYYISRGWPTKELYQAKD